MATNELVVYVIAASLVLAAGAAIVSMWRMQRQIVRSLLEGEKLAAALEGRGPDTELAREVREHFVEMPGTPAKLGVLSKPLAVIRRQYAEKKVSQAPAFWLGSVLTGVALIFTFLLIGWVMSHDVSSAISASVGTETEASVRLSSAVAMLGGKFYISAAGVVGSVGALVFGNLTRAKIFQVANTVPSELLNRFTSVEAEHLRLRYEQNVTNRSAYENNQVCHQEVCGLLTSISNRLEKLGSIEVSVKTIGNEVSANLKNIMKDAMGEQLRGMLAETMAEVADIAAALQRELALSFGNQLQALAVELQKSLAGLQKAVEGQGQGHLEKILLQLQNTVSGGFQNESEKMARALDGFAKVIPALENQLRTMTGKVAEDARQRSEHGEQITKALLTKVNGLLESLSAQQSAGAHLVERMQTAAEQSADAIARRLEVSGVGLVSSVLEASRTEIEAIVRHLRDAADASAHRYVDIETQAGNAATAVAQASEGLARTGKWVIEMANHTSTVITEAKAGSESIRNASRDFLEASGSLLGSVSQMENVIKASRVQTEEQHQLLLRQREYTKEVEKLWPELFDTYLSQFKSSADELGRSWESFHEKVARVSNSVGADFADHTEMLSQAVDRLVENLGHNGASK